MLPFHFGSPARQLFGLYHPAGGARPRAAGVLVCPPLGQEAVRTQRMFRVLADRLARAGWHVMRFDYFGTGDSAGDDEAGDLLGWRMDVATAHEELAKRSGCTTIVWVGARLGGTLAALASQDVTPPPRHLLLWEPVVSGPDYLQDLARRHVQALAQSYSIAPAELLVGPHVGEALGFGLGPALRQQLGATDLRQATPPSTSRMTVLAPPGNAELGAYLDQLRHAGHGAELVSFEHDFDWASEEALNTALVPSEALQLLTERIEACA